MMNKMKEYYIYDDEVYESEDDVEEAIIEKIGHNYNNIDVTQTGEFQDEVQNIEIVTVDKKEDADLTGKIIKYDDMTVKVLRKLTEEEKQKRAHLNNPDAGNYYEVEATSKALGTTKFIVWEARLKESIHGKSK